MTEHRLVIALSNSETLYGPWGSGITEEGQKDIDHLLENYASAKILTFEDPKSNGTLYLNPAHIVSMHQETR